MNSPLSMLISVDDDNSSIWAIGGGGCAISVEFPRPVPPPLPVLEDELLWVMPSYVDEPSGSCFISPLWFEWDSSMGLKHTHSSELKELIANALTAPLLPELSEVRTKVSSPCHFYLTFASCRRKLCLNFSRTQRSCSTSASSRSSSPLLFNIILVWLWSSF